MVAAAGSRPQGCAAPGRTCRWGKNGRTIGSETVVCTTTRLMQAIASLADGRAHSIQTRKPRPASQYFDVPASIPLAVIRIIQSEKFPVLTVPAGWRIPEATGFPAPTRAGTKRSSSHPARTAFSTTVREDSAIATAAIAG